MIKLKNLLQHRVFYIVIFLIALIYFFVYDNVFEHKSIISENSLTCIIKDYSIDSSVVINFDCGEEVIGYYNGDFSFNYGDEVKIYFTDILLEDETLQNVFNYKDYLYHKHIFKVVNVEKIDFVSKTSNIFMYLKQFIFKRVSTLSKSGNFIKTLIFAVKDDMDIYREGGISHLFAISSLHISLLILFLKKICSFLGGFSNIIIFLFLIFYVTFLGFPVQLLRCLLFFGLLFLNKFYKLDIKSIYLLILTVSILIFIDPFYIYNLGFKFSVILSFFLILSGDIIKGNYFKKTIISSFICFIVSFPIVINNFYEINITSILNNIICIPLVSIIILPLSFITIIFPFLDSVLYVFIYILNTYLDFSNSFLSINVIFCKVSLLYITLYYLSIYLYFKFRKKLFLILIIFLLFLWYFLPFNREEKVIYNYVGEGDNTILLLNDNVSIIDTGGLYSKDDSKYTYPLSKKLLTFLKSYGVRKINNLLITHGDRDHMKEAIYLIENFSVDNIYLNNNALTSLEVDVISYANKYFSNVIFLERGDSVKIGKYNFFNLNDSYEDENDSSLVLYGIIHGYKFLFLGDISSSIEKKLISEYNLNDVDILKVAHHGSYTSSCIEFLKETSPNMAIISSGINNIYHHPSLKVINNLNSLHINYLDTQQVGTIYFSLKKGTFSYYK